MLTAETGGSFSILCAGHGSTPRFPTKSTHGVFFSTKQPYKLGPIAVFTAMSGLIDIWTLERERMVRTRGAQASSFMSASFLGAKARQASLSRSGSDGSSSEHMPCCDGVRAPGSVVVMDTAGKQDAADGSAPAFVREDAFMAILVDCFGQ
ncbi:unnamed protein product [Urochloa humidicola]